MTHQITLTYILVNLDMSHKCRANIQFKKTKKKRFVVVSSFPLNFVISKICETFQKIRKITQIHNRKKQNFQHFC
jgi:hypothetical protein